MAIHIKPSHKGLLHKKLGVSAGAPIPAGKLAKARHSSIPAERKEAVFAENAKHWDHGGGKNSSQHREVTEKPAHRAANPHGNPGFHPSTKGFHHEGSTHSSKDR